MSDFAVDTGGHLQSEGVSAHGKLPAELRSISVLADQLGAVTFNTSRRRINLAIKRVIDVTGALFAVMVLSPLFLVVAIAIKLESRGPVFFVQERWGRGRSRFNVLKFRSMRVELCDPSGVAQTVVGDARLTKVGAFLRKTNIDELPQLLNVILGDMSLVGPRCHVVGMQAAGKDYEELVPQYHLRHIMRPGITGLAQMRGQRGPTADVDMAVSRVQSDLEYIASFNVFLDFTIMAKTVWFETFRGGRGL